MSYDFAVLHELAEDAKAIAELTRSKDVRVIDVLALLVNRFHATGAVLWELKGAGDKTQNELANNRGRLFTFASWFNCPGPAFTMDNLPVSGSCTGQAVREMKSLIVHDVTQHVGTIGHHPYLKRHDIHQMMCVPIESHSASSTSGRQALNLYRSRGTKPFTPRKLLRLEYNAQLVNSILDSVEDRRAVHILLDIDRLLLEQPGTNVSGPLQLAMLRFERCLRQLTGLLSCCEVSLFLVDRKDGRDFSNRLTTLKNGVNPMSAEGLTAWALHHPAGIRILDLNSFKQDHAEIQVEYEGANWTDSSDVQRFAREELGLAPEDSLPPLSFMAAPLIADDSCYGVVRCSVRRAGPTYFSERDLGILRAVAHRLGTTWQDALLQDSLEVERGAWERLSKSIEKLNTRTQAQTRIGPEQIIQSVIGEVSEIVSQVDIVDVRVPSVSGVSLEFAGITGIAWGGLPPTDRDQIATTNFDIDSPYQSLGAKVYSERRTRHVPDVRQSRYSANFQLFGTKEIVVAPIVSGDRIYGVLDLHRTGNAPFPQGQRA